MWRFVEIWAQASLAIVSWFYLVCLWVAGIALGVFAGTAPAIVCHAQHLRELTVYHLNFWCPGGPGPHALWQLWWCVCVVAGIMAAQFVTACMLKERLEESCGP